MFSTLRENPVSRFLSSTPFQIGIIGTLVAYGIYKVRSTKSGPVLESRSPKKKMGSPLKKAASPLKRSQQLQQQEKQQSLKKKKEQSPKKKEQKPLKEEFALHPSTVMKEDKHTLSNFEDIVTNAFHLKFEIDFKAKKLKGSNTLKMSCKKDGLTYIDLDIKDLIIHAVEERTQGKLSYEEVDVNHLSAIIGKQLRIQLKKPVSFGEIVELMISYETTEDSTGICWMEPEQTEGKKHYYVYTQAEPIYARTIFPCQDTPSIKCPYSAEIKVPDPYKAFMSARSQVSLQAADGYNIVTFDQPMPIPSYLVAMVIGNLETKKINERNCVISEPEVLDRYVAELDELEDYMKSIEDYLQMKYDWGIYNLVILPASFAYRGMENPNLTFASPCILAGDKSGLPTVVHEMAHSWTGNLVTNANWECFWLNEGCTRFLERKALQLLKGDECYNMLRYLGFRDLCFQIDRFGAHHEFTKLSPNLTDTNPESAISQIPFEKGFYFMTYLEELIGYEKMREFMKEYLTKHRNSKATTNDFRNDFVEFVTKSVEKGTSVLEAIDWGHWLDRPGLPQQYRPDLRHGKIIQIEKVASLFLLNNGPGVPDHAEELTVDNASAFEILIFLHYFIDRSDELTVEVVKKLNEQYNYHKKSKSAEILYRWFIVCLRARFMEIVPYVVKFLGRLGTMRYTSNLYRELALVDRDCAYKTLDNNRKFYQPMVVSMNESVLREVEQDSNEDLREYANDTSVIISN